MKTRANFYLDSDRLDALKQLAKAEETSISDLVREGIDRVISVRMNSAPRERNELRANLAAFLGRFEGRGRERSPDEIENFVTDAERSVTPI